jgi:ATP-binding protein involved in chromosome partitioning
VRIAIPVTGSQLAPHFGHCEKFAVFDADPKTKRFSANPDMPAPEHQPGLLPQWLKERGVTHVIAGGMGSRARSLFEELSVTVVTGAPAETGAVLVSRYLDGELLTTENLCDH